MSGSRRRSTFVTVPAISRGHGAASNRGSGSAVGCSFVIQGRSLFCRVMLEGTHEHEIRAWATGDRRRGPGTLGITFSGPAIMVRLSVNVNKVATLRNSRGGAVPSVLEAVDVCIAAGAPGITVHPRADRRHITPEDTRQIAHMLAEADCLTSSSTSRVIPRPDLLALVREVAPDQCTLVPVVPGEITSHAGWQPDSSSAQLRDVVADLKSRGIA